MDKEVTTQDVLIQAIKPITTDTVHKICSGQVVLNLAVAVKELVENSLDAGATNIDVRFKNYGIDLIEVSDNGTGVTEDNFAALTLKYHTSKLNQYSDLLGVSSFGFRGEALSSLCALANLIITTRHQSSDYATRIEYDNKGNIVKKTLCSRQIGTTVSVSNLFNSLPVRQKEFHKNAKREFNKMTQLLYAYCLISIGVKITCTNQTSTISKSIVVATQGSTTYKDNIACIFGIKQLQTLLEVNPEFVSNIKENIFRGLSGEVEEIEEKVHIDDVEINLSEDSNDTEITETQSSQSSISCSQKSQGYKNTFHPVEFTGYISSCAHGSGRSSTDRQFYYVNSRPCEPNKIMRLINEIYRQFNPNQYPFVFLNVNLDSTSVDVNVTPDKRKVFLTKEKIILDVLKYSLVKLFENIPRTLKVEQSISNHSKELTEHLKPELDQPRIFNSFIQRFANSAVSDSQIKSKNNENDIDLKRKSTTMLDFVSSKTKKLSSDNNKCEVELSSTELEKTAADLFEKEEESKQNFGYEKNGTIIPKLDEKGRLLDDICVTKNFENENVKFEKFTDIEEAKEIMYLEFANSLPNTQIRSLNDIVEKSSSCRNKNSLSKTNSFHNEKNKEKANQKVITDKEDLGKHIPRSMNMKISLDHIKDLTELYKKSKIKALPERVKFKSEINPVFNKKCEEELSKEISQESFKQMYIIGQFNLGFIITRLEDDLFIIDQHATDEIYNFETLQKTTELTSQKLVIPQQLELTGVNEQILMDNLDILKKNGFTFEIDREALPTKRVKLLTIPMSKNWIFGKEDIEELLFMLRESPSEYCRPSRVRAMFASRACRKSVMIGTALNKTDMRKLVDHMADIDKPWNCPHGRPTIRHLVNLAMVHTKDK